jgi:hypothetical protein
MSIAQIPGVFFATFVAATGAFTAPAQAAVGLPQPPTTNPVNNVGGTGLPVVLAHAGGTGVYTITFGTVAVPINLPTSEYKYTAGIIGGAANSNIQVAVSATGVITVTTAVAAVVTDVNFWLQIEPITG